jgi:xanthine dehydrogenase accessory factor
VAAEDTSKALFVSEETVINSLELADGYFNRMPYVVVSTQGKRDEVGLKTALKIASPYTALVASSKKAKKLMEAVSKINVSSEVIEKVRYPGGIEIGANTPEEIAVALLAELIQVKNSGREDMYTPPNIDDEVVAKPVESSGCCLSK